MPVQTGKSSLFKKLGERGVKAIKETSHEPINYGRVNLPGGIKAGIAKVTKCYFKQYETGDYRGEWFLRAEATVFHPKEVMTEQGSVNVYGQTTTCGGGPFPLCATEGNKPKTVEENVARAMNELKKMGADPDELDAVESDDDLFAIAKGIEDDAPFIKFSTENRYAQDDKKKEKPPTGAWENWNGVKEDYEPDTSDDVDDQTAAEPDADVVEEPKAKTNGQPKKKPPAAKEPDPEPVADDGDELDVLAARADDADDDEAPKAQKELMKLGLAAGLTKKWIEEVANSWTHVAEKIKEKSGGDEKVDDDRPTEDDPAAEFEPEKDGFVMYKGKKDRKAVEYEVTAVFKAKKLVNLKSIEDGKTEFKLVKWSDVTEAKID